MIGKGKRSEKVIEAIKKYKAVYFVTIGGAGALLSQCIYEAKIIAYPELGAEAIYELKVKRLPLFVANDIEGNDLYEMGRRLYQLAPENKLFHSNTIGAFPLSPSLRPQPPLGQSLLKVLP